MHSVGMDCSNPLGEKFIAFSLSSHIFQTPLLDCSVSSESATTPKREICDVLRGKSLKDCNVFCKLVSAFLDKNLLLVPHIADQDRHQVILVASVVSRVVDQIHIIMATD